MRHNLWLEDYLKGFPDVKTAVLTHYGNDKCACVNCGFTDIRVLCIDHIENDGKEHRQLLGGGNNMYKWLVDNGLPTGFQTLCMNCNWIKYREQGSPKKVRALKDKKPLLDVEYKAQSLSKRVRSLISLLDDKPFRVADIKAILPLKEGEPQSVRAIIHYMVKRGKLKPIDGKPRYYQDRQ